MEENQTPNQNEGMPQFNSPMAGGYETNPTMEKKSGGTGILIGSIIIILILVLGGAYFFFMRKGGNEIQDTTENTEETANDIANTPDANLEKLSTQGTSDSVTDIEKDVDDTNLTGLDTELNSVDQELQGAGY